MNSKQEQFKGNLSPFIWAKAGSLLSTRGIFQNWLAHSPGHSKFWPYFGLIIQNWGGWIPMSSGVILKRFCTENYAIMQEQLRIPVFFLHSTSRTGTLDFTLGVKIIQTKIQGLETAPVWGLIYFFFFFLRGWSERIAWHKTLFLLLWAQINQFHKSMRQDHLPATNISHEDGSFHPASPLCPVPGQGGPS